MGKLTQDGITALLSFFTGRDIDVITDGLVPRTTAFGLTASTTATVSGAPSSDPDQATVEQWVAKEQSFGGALTTRMRIDNATQAISFEGGVGAKVGQVTAPLNTFSVTVGASYNVYGGFVITGTNAATVGSGQQATARVWAYGDFDGGVIALTNTQTITINANAIQWRLS